MKDRKDQLNQPREAKDLLREALLDTDDESARLDLDQVPEDSIPSRHELLSEFAEHLQDQLRGYDGEEKGKLKSALQIVRSQLKDVESISRESNPRTTISKVVKAVHYWTNTSVKALAGLNPERDLPLKLITQKARDLIFEYIQQGGTNEPVDPFDLAKYKNLRVEPCEHVPDARTSQSDEGQYLIQYNPNLPEVRIRFSLCHEIAHTMFPDCWARVRNRGTHEGMVKDEWQLESLCDVGAAELLMPIGSFKHLESEPISIDVLLKAKDQLKVSTEALLLRAVKLTQTQCFVFSASRADQGAAQYKLDYAYRSRSFRAVIPYGLRLPKNTVVSSCLRFGYTDKANEIWSPALGMLRVECVAVSPYPDRVLPRVMGIAVPVNQENATFDSIKYRKGDALQPSSSGNRIIAHVVNDRTPTWGGGFALVVRRRLPDVQRNFYSWASSDPNRLVLGNSHISAVDERTDVFSMICQHGYGQKSKPSIRYSALKQCLERLAVLARERNATVHMPRIGCGQAMGNWQIVSEMIMQILSEKEIGVTVYDLPGTEFIEKQRSLF